MPVSSTCLRTCTVQRKQDTVSWICKEGRVVTFADADEIPEHFDKHKAPKAEAKAGAKPKPKPKGGKGNTKGEAASQAASPLS